MHLAYFVIDEEQQLRRTEAESVEAVWEGRAGTSSLKYELPEELRLVSVLIDEDLNPLVCFFLRLDLDGEEITDETRLDAYEAVTARHQNQLEHPAAQRQLEGWPDDWQRQMAVALDVPIMEINRIAIGGPLLMSDLWGVSVAQVVEYFQDVIEEEGL
ncbi:hypothetical protein [Calycomorphotria hydatis]|uniref:Uncharacterized protein n=1 Tax=Calycomorphotria hydatis TaxID=2528027 RepID=A0A517TBX2_9PLAN|nr:hypothetical protein [Calycomorphotria hydatis]QDT65864.1 hypothetical protein V22_31260 [Calycomorphotria hydatis]